MSTSAVESRRGLLGGLFSGPREAIAKGFSSRKTYRPLPLRRRTFVVGASATAGLLGTGCELSRPKLEEPYGRAITENPDGTYTFTDDPEVIDVVVNPVDGKAASLYYEPYERDDRKVKKIQVNHGSAINYKVIYVLGIGNSSDTVTVQDPSGQPVVGSIFAKLVNTNKESVTEANCRIQRPQDQRFIPKRDTTPLETPKPALRNCGDIF